MEPVILFRHDRDTEEEMKIASSILPTTSLRCGLENKLVIPRYSCLPYYKELEDDLAYQGSKLINSFRQHKYIADFSYYHDIEDLTPKTYFNFDRIPDNGGPFIVKGVTNSRKFLWKELMYAPDKKSAINIAIELQKDGLIGQQDIIVRDFVKLNVLEEGVTGVPFSNEWRFFCLGKYVISYGFYWSCSEKRGELNSKCWELLTKVIERVSQNVNFYVVDLAECVDGSWIVIEMNDASMSGLSENDPNLLYKTLKLCLEKYDWQCC